MVRVSPETPGRGLHRPTERRTHLMKPSKKLLMLTPVIAAMLSLTTAHAEIESVSALAEVYTYHQIKAFVIEYDQEVAEPAADTYEIVDFAPSHMKELYDQRPFAEAVITAVYTNDEPAIREDKTSVAGKYVIIEQELVNGSYWDEAAQMWKPNNLCGLGTWRLLGEACEWFRNDYSELIISQQKNVVNAAGEIVQKPGLVPTLQPENIHTALLDDFQITTHPSYNGKYDIHYSIALPENYDASKQYPVVVTCHGQGGSLNYQQQDAEGNLLCIGGDLGRDAVPVSWMREVDEDVIVLSIQRWTKAPAEWEVNAELDCIKLIEELAQKYSFNMDRIYAIGSSAGSMHLAKVITLRPDLFAGYMQCNSVFNWANIYKKEYQLDGGDVLTTSTYAFSLDTREDCLMDDWSEAEAILKCVADAKLPMYIWHGVNDDTFSWTYALSEYKVLRKLYQDAGLPEAEINNLVKLYLADDPEYHDVGICEIHATSKLAVWYPWVMEWLLAQ